LKRQDLKRGKGKTTKKISGETRGRLGGVIYTSGANHFLRYSKKEGPAWKVVVSGGSLPVVDSLTIPKQWNCPLIFVKSWSVSEAAHSPGPLWMHSPEIMTLSGSDLFLLVVSKLRNAQEWNNLPREKTITYRGTKKVTDIRKPKVCGW